MNLAHMCETFKFLKNYSTIGNQLLESRTIRHFYNLLLFFSLRNFRKNQLEICKTNGITYMFVTNV